ncbi:MAG TPA: 5'-deoxynucleotidase [Clostridiaceae bacterium]|nr:5'-deoxynucleotidase [Clostridiaceae bacterium]
MSAQQFHSQSSTDENVQYGFYAMLDRMRWIRRWSLMRNAHDENLAEHSLLVAIIGHALGIIRNLKLVEDESERPEVNPDAIAVRALFHDATEIITGDLPTPVKYHDPGLRDAYRRVEKAAEIRLLSFLPDNMRTIYAPLLTQSEETVELDRFVKAADVLTAYIKCAQEVSAGNGEFRQALQQTRARAEAIDLPECAYFMAHFCAGFTASLDELNGEIREEQDEDFTAHQI